LFKETVDGLNVTPGGIYVDGTLGGAGHAKSVCEQLKGQGRFIGIDQDEDAIAVASERLKEFPFVTIVRSNYESMAEVLKNRKLTVNLLKYKGQEKDFAQRFSQYENLTFQTVDTPEELVTGSDVVISGVTYAPTNFCSDECFQKGVLVVPIHTLGFTNCDLFFDKVFADDYGHVCNFRYFNKFKKFAEMTDVVTGKVPGRESDDERILAYNIGISVHDVYFASKIYSMISADRKLPEVQLNTPKQKFWI
jgi:ornithine cyclodeaminase/alanine dehydrogenase